MTWWWLRIQNINCHGITLEEIVLIEHLLTHYEQHFLEM